MAVITLLLCGLVMAASEKRGKILQNYRKYWKLPCEETMRMVVLGRGVVSSIFVLSTYLRCKSTLKNYKKFWLGTGTALNNASDIIFRFSVSRFVLRTAFIIII